VTLTWEAALDECEARLDAAVAALERTAPGVVAPFSADEIEGPLPAALADRAQACCTRGQELERRLADELERVRLELRRLPRVPQAPQAARYEARA
jgi:hypothetical protein